MNFEMLMKLCRDGASGYEENISAFISERISPYVDEVYADALKNVVALKKGKKKNPKKVMLFSHIDRSGFIVTHIEDNGKIRFSPLGNLEISSTLYREVFLNGFSGVIIPEAPIDKLSYTSLYLDIGAHDRLDAEKSVSVGDCFYLNGYIEEMKNERFFGAALNARVGASILLYTASSLKECEDDVYFVFSTQKLVGNRGIKPVANSIRPDIAICIDLSMSKHADSKANPSQLGQGPALLIKDKSVICHEKLTAFVRSKADKLNIPMQIEISNFGSSELSVVQAAGEGVMVAGVNIPCENPQTCAEIISASDIENAEKLMLSLASSDFSEII